MLNEKIQCHNLPFFQSGWGFKMLDGLYTTISYSSILCSKLKSFLGALRDFLLMTKCSMYFLAMSEWLRGFFRD